MTSITPDAKSVFGRAVEIASAGDRAAFLDEACAGRPGVRAEVETLLKALGNAGSFMASPAAPAGETGSYDAPIAEGEGTVIGPYTLREQIGEGGMGLVFVAEQFQPVRRKVALKVIKPGMDTRQVVARFEAERQALALMEHPNIAKVLDAGTTDSGRPYFVMELVRGVPITEYCDANNLMPRDRLRLFVQVCQAVQHAHQKGVIHRDLKPSNILVAPHDSIPVVKVIDFGVAKALGPSLTEKTIYTRLAQIIGTPLYMSPEQAEVNQLDVDTRSDVYSLGVLLYELLTGTTPFDGDRFRKAAFDEIRRILKEEEPPRPSTRLSSLGATLTAVSAKRGTEPAKLSRLMRGELDWVVMKCLEKDRSRRYDTASNLARDVERFLKDEPVEARSPSAWYRLRKAARRNRAALTVIAAVATALLLGTSVAVWQASLARGDRQRAEKADNDRIEAEAAAAGELRKLEKDLRRQYTLERAIEAAFSGDLEKARNAILDAQKAGVDSDQVYWLNGLVHFQRGDLDAAIMEFKSSLALKQTVAAQAMLARAYIHAGLQSGGNQLDHEYPQALVALRAMTPVTAEDYMCRGCALPMNEPEQRLSDLDKAIAMRDSPIARTFRAQAAATAGMASRDLKLLERGIEDVRQAKFRLRDNPFIRYTSACIQMPAATLYSEAGQPEKRAAALAEAKDDVKALENIPVTAYMQIRVAYFEGVGDDDAALKLLEQAVTREETKELVWLLSLALYRKGQVEQALDALDQSRQPENTSVQVLRVLLMAEHPRYGPDKAYEEYQKLTGRAREKGRPVIHRDAAIVLLFLGRRTEAAEALREVGHRSEASGIETSTGAEYVGESMSEEEFLRAGKAGPLDRCFQHHLIGLVQLSQGDRKGAAEHFQKSLDTMLYLHTLYQYSRVFLERLKRDPEWPKWIEVKK